MCGEERGYLAARDDVHVANGAHQRVGLQKRAKRVLEQPVVAVTGHVRCIRQPALRSRLAQRVLEFHLAAVDPSVNDVNEARRARKLAQRFAEWQCVVAHNTVVTGSREEQASHDQDIEAHDNEDC